jgi:HEAT repeat protein
MKSFFLRLCLAVIATAGLSAAPLQSFDVIWDSPSKDEHGSMPLGNGDISLNAWIEPSGDLVFYIGKTDAWDDNSRLLKIGKVRVALEPAPAVAPFRQELSLEEGTMNVRYGDGTTLRVWVDANHPTIHVDVAGKQPTTANSRVELWRTNQFELPSIECSDVMTDRSKPKNMHAPTIVEPDTVLTGLTGRVGWYHRNIKSVGPAIHAETQGVTGYPREDPLLHRTFGAMITAANGKRLDDVRLQSPAANEHQFAIHVLTRHPATPESWLAEMNALIAATEKTSLEKRCQAHEQWWGDFWSRSWIRATQNPNVRSTAPLIPANQHPLRIGVDQTGTNKFPGEIRNTRVPESFTGPFTLEAEVKPAAGGQGRIFDKITVGGSDGFLLDLQPGNTLRLISGANQFNAKGALPAGQWTRIVAAVDARGWRVSVNGREVLNTTNAAAGDDAAYVSQMYALQRFITACAGRGRYPIKFNGSIFTVAHEGGPGEGDYRRWGPGYWWQNTRLPYLSLCASGDYEMMEPLWRLYVDDFLPLNQYRTQRYFGLEGAAYYIECVHFWGDVFNETYGWQPVSERKDPLQSSGYHKWEWVAGPELVWMMLDDYEHTLDASLLRNRIVPTADAVMRFFDGYYKTNDAGLLVMHPSQALETWWDCTNPMPELAGLRAITARLLALPEAATPPASRAYWKTFLAKLPPLPTRDTPDGKALAPAEIAKAKNNVENPELYAVFPFRLCSFEKENRDLGIQALKHRWDRGDFGWRQDDIFMAYLGLTEDVRKAVVARARNHDKNSRFPAFWGPNYDWVPDQDHGGVLMKAFQSMLMQTDGQKIFLLPAWPKEWNVEFKLHAPLQTVVEGTYQDGKLASLKVTPAERERDVLRLGEAAEGLDIDSVLSSLAHDDPSVRSKGAEGITDGLIHKRLTREQARVFLPQLLLNAQDRRNPVVRARSADAIGMIGAEPDACVPALIRLLDDRVNLVRSSAAHALGGFGKAASAALPRLLTILTNDSYGPVRQMAVETLSQLSQPEAYQAVYAARNDKDSGVRNAAINGLGNYPDYATETLPFLVRVIETESESPAWNVLWALGRLGPLAKDALPAVKKLLENPNRAGGETTVRKAIQQIEGR